MNTKTKRIALIAYDPPDYFLHFTRALEERGFEAYWVTTLPSSRRQLTGDFAVPPQRVLDVSIGLDTETPQPTLDECRRDLAKLETAEGPRLNDLILMDRLLRLKPQAFAIRYLHHLQRTLTAFLSQNHVTLVTSGRDSAIQLMAMLVCRQLGVPWVVPTRLRIPPQLYGFCRGHLMTDLVKVRSVTDDDRAWARQFVAEFDAAANRPELKVAARGVGDAMRLLPLHLSLFGRAVGRSFADRSNDFTRYTVSQLVGMYLRRRKNLLNYRVRPPYAAPGTAPFCLYGLHTQPESSIDVAGSFFSDQTALITFIARSLPATHEFYVKVHPTDVDGKPRSFYERIAAIPGVRVIDYAVDSRDLIRRASIVFSLTGTMAYEAGIMGKPVITFGNVFFNALPTVHYCDAPPALPALVDAVLRGPAPPNVTERIVDVLADLKSRAFEGEVNRMYGSSPSALSSDDLRSLADAYERLHDLLAEPCAPVSRAPEAAEPTALTSS